MSITVKKEFEFDFLEDTWSGAKDRMNDLTDDLRDRLEDIISSDTEGLFGEDIPTDTQVNDFLWFDDDTYADWLGFRDADQLWKYCDLVNKGVDEDEIYTDGDDFTTLGELEKDFSVYQAENDDWADDYADVFEYIEDQGYEKFEV